MSPNNYASLLLICCCCLCNSVIAQRPSYAGSRPPAEHTQKQKYQPQYLSSSSSSSNSSSNSSSGNSNDNSSSNSDNSNINNNSNFAPNVDIRNRFSGSSESSSNNSLLPPRPPVGLPVVMPELVFIPLPAAGVTVDNRLGTINSSAANTNTNTNSSQQQPPPPPPPALPIDAHGDADLVRQLSLLPEDKRPFWFLNYQAIEAQRNGSRRAAAGTPTISRGSFFG